MATTPLRVLRLTPSYEPPRSALDGRHAAFNPIGGVQNHTAQLTRALDRRGVDQVVLTTRPPTAPLRQREGRARIYRLGLPTPRWRQLYAPQAALLAPALGRRADVVHVHFTSDLGVVPVAALAARAAGSALVATVHCSLRHTLALDSDHARRLHRRGAPVEGWLARRADAVVVLSHRLAERMADDGVDPAKVHVVPSGVDPSAFAAGPFADPFPEVPRPRIVYHGRLEPEKDVRTLVAALPLLRSGTASLLLVGDGSQRAALRAQAEALGVADRVHLPGYLHHDDVPALLAHADVAVLPSVFEELGTAVVEALYAGVPVVASGVGGIREVVADGTSGLLVPPGRPAAWAKALDRVLADRALAERLAAGARRSASRLQWPALAERVHEVYESVLARSSRPAPAHDTGAADDEVAAATAAR